MSHTANRQYSWKEDFAIYGCLIMIKLNQIQNQCKYIWMQDFWSHRYVSRTRPLYSLSWISLIIYDQCMHKLSSANKNFNSFKNIIQKLIDEWLSRLYRSMWNSSFAIWSTFSCIKFIFIQINPFFRHFMQHFVHAKNLFLYIIVTLLDTCGAQCT